MNRSEYLAQQRRFNRFWKRWRGNLGIGWWKVDLLWHDEPVEPEGHEGLYTAANVVSDWRYREATINVFLPVIKELSDRELEKVIVHECCHILVEEMRPDDGKVSDHEERVCSSLAAAFLWVRDAAAGGKL